MEKIELNDKIELTNQEKEVYRTLRTNLEFTGVENRVIAITSCTRDDGKSTVAYNPTFWPSCLSIPAYDRLESS